MSDLILHVTARAAWSAVQASGQYTADSLASQGFIHCSRLEQVLRTANLFFKGQSGLVVLVIDPQRLRPELRWEPGADLASELFPHIYGPLNLDAVTRVLDFAPGPNGSFTLPDLNSPAG